MGKFRGKRNAAREKCWPGERADKLRAEKRLSLEQQANMLLYGYPNVEEGANEPEFICVFGTANQPPKKTPIVYAEPKVQFYKNEVCTGCGKARAPGSATQCRACYRETAREKFVQRSSGIEFFMDRSMNSAWGGRETVKNAFQFERVTYQEDFVPALIEKIAEQEFTYDAPFYLIKEDRQSAQSANNGLPIYYGLGSGAKIMFDMKKRLPSIRHRRPKWKMLRGQWA